MSAYQLGGVRISIRGCPSTAVLDLMAKAKEAVISFDISKTELIYFYNKCIIIEEGLKLGDIEIPLKPLVR